MSNLKLQKLVYYAQGTYLAVHSKPLFKEQIEAWTHGPVVAELYHRFKQHGSDSIEFDEQIDMDKYDDNAKEVLDSVYSFFGQYSGWKLRNMTHGEPPWKEAADGGVITHAAMKNYFDTIIVAE
ncbi:MAG: DUF4065 domain-containing protein [Sulfuritalea sp.]|nr:DUF4065 domain-containing protein [Sulfuritalea sp.]